VLKGVFEANFVLVDTCQVSGLLNPAPKVKLFEVGIILTVEAMVQM
jgi:hypothetical protein